MLWLSIPKTEHHHLPTGPIATSEGVGQVTFSPSNAAMIPPRSDIQDEEQNYPIAANPPLSAPGQPPPADMALPTSYPTSPIDAIGPSRQTSNSSSQASISTHDDRASKEHEPTTNQVPNDDTTIPSVDITELVGQQVMTSLATGPSKWTLTDMINHILENDILLPTEEEINGNRAANAVGLPVGDSPPFYDEYESAMVDFTRANPGFRPHDGLQIIGESIYYEDKETGRIRRRVGQFNPVDPRHPAHRAVVGATMEQGEQRDLGGGVKKAGSTEDEVKSI
ncbi:MAG: hypothetical protein Q9171_000861 [Xanthocarpia ochracea]